MSINDETIVAIGKDAFYKKLGFKRMTTAMAIFKNQAEVLASGIVVDEA